MLAIVFTNVTRSLVNLFVRVYVCVVIHEHSCITHLINAIVQCCKLSPIQTHCQSYPFGTIIAPRYAFPRAPPNLCTFRPPFWNTRECNTAWARNTTATRLFLTRCDGCRSAYRIVLSTVQFRMTYVTLAWDKTRCHAFAIVVIARFSSHFICTCRWRNTRSRCCRDDRRIIDRICRNYMPTRERHTC